MIIDMVKNEVRLKGYKHPIPLCEKVPEGFKKIRILDCDFYGVDFYYKEYGNRLVAVQKPVQGEREWDEDEENV